MSNSRMPHEDVLSRIEALHSETGCDRAELARTLIESELAEVVIIADVGQDETGVVPTSLVVDGARRGPLTGLVRNLAIGPMPDLSRPAPAERRFFTPPRPADEIEFPGLGPELRLLVGDDEAVTSYIGLFGPPDRLTPSRSLRELLRDQTELFRELLLGSRRKPEVAGGFVLDGKGEVLGGEPLVVEWLNRSDRARTLRTLLQLCRSGDTVEGPLDGSRARMRRGDGPFGPMWLGEVVSTDPVVLAPDAQLTPTQRRVAHSLALGLTAKEVAAELGIGTETARGHLRDIYARLGVKSRIELARRLGTLEQLSA